MANAYDILVELRATDAGFAAAFAKAGKKVEELSQKLVVASRSNNPDHNAGQYRKMAEAQKMRVAELRNEAKALLELEKKQNGLNAEQAKELAMIQQMITKRQQLAATYSKIASIRDQDAKQAELQYQLAKKITGLEAQAAQSASGEVSRRRIIAEIAKQKQDAEVKSAVLADKGARSAGQELSIRQQLVALATQETLARSAAVTKQKIATALAKDEQDVQVRAAVSAQQNARAASAAAAAYGNFAQRLGRAIASLVTVSALLRASTGALKMVASASLAAGKAVGFGLVKSLQILVGIARTVISVMGKVAGAVGRTAAAVGRTVGSFASALRAKQRYREVTGEVADAEGWHSRSLKGLVGNVVNVNRWINTLGSSVRQLGQAFQNAGTTFSIFVSLPLTMFGRGLFDTAVEFNSQLIEIRKNADIKIKPEFEGEFSLEQLDSQLRDIAAESPTKIVDLGKIAVDAAKLGFDPEVIAPFVEIMDKFVVSTDVAADEAVDSVGRIMSIFYDMSSSGITQDVKEFEGVVLGLASAINEVGQANPIGEKDVIATLLRMAPGARALNMSLADAIGLSASVASASASAERAGTQLGTALNMTAQNLEKIADAGGMSMESLRQFADTDITASFVGIAEAISKIESPTRRAAAAQELFGAIGGKAVNILSAGVPNVVENIAISNAAFEAGTSIILEFDRAMDSVSNQLGLLRNQFDLIGLALGDALLPAITDVLAYLVPIMQGVARGFREMDQPTKMLIVGVAMLTAVLGPLLVALGSIMFSVGILTTGLTGLFTVIGKVIAIPLSLAAALLTLLSPFKLIMAAAVAAAMAMAGFGGMLGDLGSMVVNFAQNMYVWGYNAFMGFGDGIEDAASYVVDMVVAVLTTIRAMLEAFSPPKEGPLKDIDVWGRNVAQTFVDGFAEANMEPVREFAGLIASATEGMVRGLGADALTMYGQLSSVITTAIGDIGGALGLDTEVIDENKIDGLEAFVGVLHAMQNGTASLADAFEQLKKYTGAFGSDIEKLIKLQDEYNDGQERLEEIQERLDNFDRETDAEVKAIAARKDLSTRERISLIRQARAAAVIRKTQLEDEQRMAQIQQENIQKQIDLQKQLIQILSDLLPGNRDGASGSDDIDSNIDKIGDDAEEASEKIGDLEGHIDGMKEKLSAATDDMKSKFANMDGELGKFVKSMSTAREQLKGFLDALLGKDRPEGEVTPDYMIGWDKGWETRERYLTWLTDVKTGWENLRTAGDNLAAAMGSLAAGFKLVFGEKTDAEVLLAYNAALGPLAVQLFGFGIALGTAAKKLGEYGSAASSVFGELAGIGDKESLFDAIIRKLGEFREAFMNAFGDGNPAINKPILLLAPFGGIAMLLGTISGLAFDNIDELGGFLGTIAKFLMSLWGVAGAISVIAASFAGMNSGNLTALLKENLELIGNGKLTEVIQDALALGNPGDPIGTQIVDYIAKQIQAADWSRIATDLANGINKALFGSTVIGSGLGGGVTETPGLVDFIDVSVIVEPLGEVVQVLSDFVAELAIGEFGVKIGEELNKITKELAEIDWTDASNNIFIGIADALGSVEFKEVRDVVVNFLNAIVDGVASGVGDQDFDSALRNFVAQFVSAVAGIKWDKIVDVIKNFAISLLNAIANAPWGEISESLVDLIESLLRALGSPDLWKAATDAVLSLAIAIGNALTDVAWGDIFTVDAMMDFAGAFVEGLKDAFQRQFPGMFGDESAAPVPPSHVDGSQRWLTAQELAEITERNSSWSYAYVPSQAELIAEAIRKANMPPAPEVNWRPANNWIEADLLSEFMFAGTLFANDMYTDLGGTVESLFSNISEFRIDWSGVVPPAEELGAAAFDALFGGFVPMSASAAPLESGARGLQDFSIYGSQIAQAALELQPMHTAQTYQEWIASQEAMSQSVETQTGTYTSFLPMVSNASRLTTDATTGLSEVGKGLETLSTVSGGYKERLDAVLPALTALSQGAASTDGVSLGKEIGTLLGMTVLGGFSDYVVGEGLTSFNSLLMGYMMWLANSVELVKISGGLMSLAVLAGMSTYVVENKVAFDVLLSTLTSWIVDSAGALKISGESIASNIISGIQSLLSPKDYFNVIEDSFSSYVGSINGSHGIVKDANDLGEEIADAIGDGISDNWKEIRDSLQDAIQRAIDSVDVNVSPTAETPSDRTGSRAGFVPRVGAAIDPNLYGDFGVKQSVSIVINGPIYASSEKDVDVFADRIYRRISEKMARDMRHNRR